MDFVLSTGVTGVTDYYYQISSYMTPFSPKKKVGLKVTDMKECRMKNQQR